MNSITYEVLVKFMWSYSSSGSNEWCRPVLCNLVSTDHMVPFKFKLIKITYDLQFSSLIVLLTFHYHMWLVTIILDRTKREYVHDQRKNSIGQH